VSSCYSLLDYTFFPPKQNELTNLYYLKKKYEDLLVGINIVRPGLVSRISSMERFSNLLKLLCNLDSLKYVICLRLNYHLLSHC